MKQTFENFDNPNAPWNTNRLQIISSIKYNTIACEYFSLMLTDDTVSDFTDCRVHDTTDTVEILTNDNTMIVYYHHAIKGYTYRIKNYPPRTNS